MPRVTIISPNHVEALSLYGRIPSPNTSDTELELLLGGERKVEEALVEIGTQLLRDMQADQRRQSRGGWERGVVIRCGAKGCMVFTADGIEKLPAYSTESRMVVDVTGGGNAFMGGLVAGMDRTDGKSLVEGERVLSITFIGCADVDPVHSCSLWSHRGVLCDPAIWAARACDGGRQGAVEWR